MRLETAGLPTVLVATGELRPLTARTAVDLGLPNLRVVYVQHPIGGVDQATIEGRADGAVDEVLALLTGSTHRPDSATREGTTPT